MTRGTLDRREPAPAAAEAQARCRAIRRRSPRRRGGSFRPGHDVRGKEDVRPIIAQRADWDNPEGECQTPALQRIRFNRSHVPALSKGRAGRDMICPPRPPERAAAGAAFSRSFVSNFRFVSTGTGGSFNHRAGGDCGSGMGGGVAAAAFTSASRVSVGLFPPLLPLVT
jgi:hypothetical protein